MPRVSQAQAFDRAISQFIVKRAEYARGLAEIDALFAKYGIKLNGTPTAVTPGRKDAVNRAAKPRTRRRFAQTAEEFVLALVKAKNNLSTADVNAAWKKNGRGGTADNMLGKLVNEKKLKRTPIKDGRGSTYSLT